MNAQLAIDRIFEAAPKYCAGYCDPETLKIEAHWSEERVWANHEDLGDRYDRLSWRYRSDTEELFLWEEEAYTPQAVDAVKLYIEEQGYRVARITNLGKLLRSLDDYPQKGSPYHRAHGYYGNAEKPTHDPGYYGPDKTPRKRPPIIGDSKAITRIDRLFEGYSRSHYRSVSLRSDTKEEIAARLKRNAARDKAHEAMKIKYPQITAANAEEAMAWREVQYRSLLGSS